MESLERTIVLAKQQYCTVCKRWDLIEVRVNVESSSIRNTARQKRVLWPWHDPAEAFSLGSCPSLTPCFEAMCRLPNGSASGCLAFE
jgi:hypothetical protein